jgi:hypothetical protein
MVNNVLGRGYCPTCLNSEENCSCRFCFPDVNNIVENNTKNKYVAAIEYNTGCPICDMNNYDRMQAFNNIDEIKEFSLKNMNEYEIIDILSLNGIDFLKIKYIASSHKYVGIMLFINNKCVSETCDNGSGELYWKNLID